MESLLEVKAKVNAEFGAGAVMSLSEVPAACPAISTGIFILDHIMGVGGFPQGRLIELFGPEASGKSTVLLHTCASCQKKGWPVLYLDYENALDPQYASRLGVDLGDAMFALSQPDDLEQGMAIAEKFIEADAVGLIVVDSLAAMMPRAELYDAKGKTRNIGDSTPMAAQGKAMAEALRRLTGKTAKSNICFCFINQTRIDLKAAKRGFHKITTPGSGTLKFYASMRVELRKTVGIKGKIENPNTGEMEEGVIATVIEANIVKNKVAPPFRRCKFVLSQGYGVSNVMTIVQIAIDRGIIQSGGAGYYTCPDTVGCDPIKLRGLERVFANYKHYPEVMENLEKLVQDAICHVEPEQKQVDSDAIVALGDLDV